MIHNYVAVFVENLKSQCCSVKHPHEHCILNTRNRENAGLSVAPIRTHVTTVLVRVGSTLGTGRRKTVHCCSPALMLVSLPQLPAGRKTNTIFTTSASSQSIASPLAGV